METNNSNNNVNPMTDSSYVSINVMQALVEEKVDKCMAEAGMCTCPRCRIDVMALALSRLPSKYVVLHANDTLPMLTVYANRYATILTTEIMSACQRIQKNPRHSDQENRSNIAFIRG